MAHDFSIRVPNGIWSKRYNVTVTEDENSIYHEYTEKEEYKGIPDDQVFFFGYADGIFYKAFRCEECNNLLSGDGSISLIPLKKDYKNVEYFEIIFS
ncbi:hypothetical protein [Thomasclavelia cocleata]|uniref:hypothetical protein n=1 Tax=Thomasclavelia cocleata TaxID=69824 RepID=UPI00242E5984|nr:hypothetical protein [Thomasclavelia cocleata]MCI9630117.1 hypothetical protein [Thomasclavelia cocleata]